MTQSRLNRRTALAGLLGGAAIASGALLNRPLAHAALTAAGGETQRRWLSGAGDDTSRHVADGGFGDWRGEASTYARVWADRSFADMNQVWMMDPYTAARWTGTLDIACGGPQHGQTWTSAAKGGMDATWRTTCRTIKAKWGQLSGVHLSMAHELNGTWFPWSVGNDEAHAFRSAWTRWYDIVQEELVADGKNAKVGLCLNWDTPSSVKLSGLLPDERYYDVLGVDFYSMYPDLTNQSAWDSSRLLKKRDGSPRGIQAWFDFAKSMGKPVSFPEWGLNPQQRSDNPFFIRQMHGVFRANAPRDPQQPEPGEVAGEAYFNTWDACRLWPNTATPDAAAAYRSLTFGR